MRLGHASYAYIDGKSGSELSLHSQRFLARKSPDDLGQWFGTLMEHSRTVFQPWSMELLFVAGVMNAVSIASDWVPSTSARFFNSP